MARTAAAPILRAESGLTRDFEEIRRFPMPAAMPGAPGGI
jgi:hypothetical protein